MNNYNMKKIIIIAIAILIISAGSQAQQISVVAPNGNTQLFTDLNAAIVGAATGSVIYLSGGGFQIKDETKITKKLSIIGVGHLPNNDNADGNTIVSGHFSFEGGADGSVLMGLHLSGNVNIGTGGAVVNAVLIRYCNINSIQVLNAGCKKLQVNQCYLRGGSNGGNSSISFTNNIINSVGDIRGGVVNHNVVKGGVNATDSQIKDNLLIGSFSGSGVISHNMCTSSWGDNCLVVESWDNVIVGPDNGVNVTSRYELKSVGRGDASDGTDVGIYGGTRFKDSATPPVQRIVSKKIAEQTDENGNLNVQIQVKTK
jgi:hypothetical protein